jgi:uncharacterized protein with HEPN domain
LKKLVRPYLHDIRNAIAGIEAATAGKTLNEYSNNWLLRSAVERGVEIISEASRRIPPELRETQPQVPWKKIIGIGNVLRHDYRDVVNGVMWESVMIHLPILKAGVFAIDANLDEPRE